MEVASPALVMGGYRLAGSLSLLLARSSLFVSAINYKLHSRLRGGVRGLSGMLWQGPLINLKVSTGTTLLDTRICTY